MARYAGLIGFAKPVETAPGVFQDVITERPYLGEVTRNINRWQSNERVNDDLHLNCAVRILADSYAFENIGVMKYIVYEGSKWKITSFEINRPRITVFMGSIYNG